LKPRRIVIMGAGGRDFHVFNMLYRDNPEYLVVAFTAAQIPGIEWKRYPPSLAGPRYPHGIPILPESKLEDIVVEESVDEVVLAYSDLTYDELGWKVRRVIAAGASFRIPGAMETMLRSYKPVIAVTAVKTGAGKSSVSRLIAVEAAKMGLRPVVVRHPMAYGDLESRRLICVRTRSDLGTVALTLEEREELEPYLDIGVPVVTGIETGLVLRRAEELGDIIVWDGGNNDTPFIRPDYWIVVVDATRPELIGKSFPGDVNIRRADLAIVTKASTAGQQKTISTLNSLRRINPSINIAIADMIVEVDEPERIKERKVVVVEDAPTVTHGGSSHGAGYIAAIRHGGVVVDPRPYAVGEVARVYEKYSHIGPVVPTIGYTRKQLEDLAETLKRIPAEVVIVASPASIEEVIKLDKPIVRVKFHASIVEGPKPREIIEASLKRYSG